MAKPKSSGNAWELSVIYRLYWRTNWKTINMQGAWNISFLFNEKISRGSVRLNQTTMFCPTKSYRRNAYSLSFHLHDTSQKVLFPSHVFSIFCRLSALNYTERERERESSNITYILTCSLFSTLERCVRRRTAWQVLHLRHFDPYNLQVPPDI